MHGPTRVGRDHPRRGFRSFSVSWSPVWSRSSRSFDRSVGVAELRSMTFPRWFWIHRRSSVRGWDRSGSLAAMDRETTFLLALGLLIAAAAVVSVCGWILFVRDRRAGRSAPGEETAERVDVSAAPDPRSSDA